MSYVVEQRIAATSPSHTRAPELDRVRSHLAAAVVCTLVCFAPLGVAAVVYAGNVRTRPLLARSGQIAAVVQAGPLLEHILVEVPFGP
ncbi:MAG: CD225/dispanin family protein, partial [Jiangellaceae bacterium]